MRGGRDRDRLRRRIDAGAMQLACTVGIFPRNARRAPARIEERAAAGGDLGEHAARHDVARRKFGQRVQACHEALAALVDQDRAFAAQALRCERRGIAPDHDRGRVELDEFGIGNDGAGARGDRKPEPLASAGWWSPHRDGRCRRSRARSRGTQ
jgi:hypothetical protein